jgi:CDP-paratose 2-epimerase
VVDVKWNYVNQQRKGDHICYISNLKKLQGHFPNWHITVGLDEILKQIIESQEQRLRTALGIR